MNQHAFSCIILAGGLGKRLDGADKGLQEYQGKPLITHVIKAVFPQVDDIVISANRNLDWYKQLGYAVVADEDPDYAGPLAGIVSAIPRCEHDWILITPCDMPSLPDDLVATMARHADRSDLLVVRHKDRLQLLLLLHRRILPSLKSYLSRDQRSVMGWVESSDYYPVPIDNENYFRNINTGEQLRN